MTRPGGAKEFQNFCSWIRKNSAEQDSPMWSELLRVQLPNRKVARPMLSGPSWAYDLWAWAATSICYVVELVGFILMIRWWHVGTPSRLAALGFGLMLIRRIASRVGLHVFQSIPDHHREERFLAFAVNWSLDLLLHVAALSLLFVALWMAFRQIDRLPARHADSSE